MLKQVLLEFSIDEDKSIHLPHTHHAHAPSATGARTHKIRTKVETNAASTSGKIQYPNTHKDWKNDL